MYFFFFFLNYSKKERVGQMEGAVRWWGGGRNK